MISKNILEFLNLLKFNNTRDWFHANKDLYEKAKKDFEDYTGYLINEISSFDKNTGYLESRKMANPLKFLGKNILMTPLRGL